MAKLGTEWYHHHDKNGRRTEFKFQYDVNVDKEGIFSTTLPKDIVEQFKAANIDMRSNRIGNEGYLAAETKEGLMKLVKDIAEEFMSRELISEKIVIRYAINTACHYCIVNGEVVPNGHYVPSDERNANYWKGGNIHNGSTDRHPYSLSVYAKPFVKREYQYKSGKTKIEYEQLCYGGDIAHRMKEADERLAFLDDFVKMYPDSGDVQDVDYTADTCRFFTNLVVAICKLNEQIKDLTPEAIMLIAAGGGNLLGGPKKKE